MKHIRQLLTLLIIGLCSIYVTQRETIAATYKEMANNVPAPVTNLSRLYLYRVRKFASLRHPDVILDGKLIWTSESGAVTYIDTPPGRHKIEVDGNDLTFISYPNETKYVNFGIRMGDWTSQFLPQLLSSKYGMQNIQDLDFVPITSSSFTKPNLP